MTTKRNYNVILSVEDSEKWKAFCIEHDIEWFRTEYGKDRYCQITATESEKIMVDHFLQYVEDNRPTLDEVCEEYEERTEKCPAKCPGRKFCTVEID